MQENSQEQGAVVREQREKIQNGQMRDRRFGDDGARVQLSRGEARLYIGGIHVRGVRGGSHSVTAGGGAAPKMRAAKSSEFGVEKLLAPWRDSFGASAALH